MMNFLPLMLMMDSMKKDNSAGGIDGMISSLANIKKLEQMQSSNNPMDMMSTIMGQSNPQMANAMNMMKMMNNTGSDPASTFQNSPKDAQFDSSSNSCSDQVRGDTPINSEVKCHNHSIAYFPHRKIFK